MHQPRSARTVRAMKLSAVAFLFLGLNVLVTVPLVAYALIEVDRKLLLMSLGLIGAGVILLFIYRIAGSAARCSLCSSPVMLSRSCARNNKAKRVFGSYRARVAFGIVFTGKFTCPYCGEPTLCQPRQRPPQQPLHQHGH